MSIGVNDFGSPRCWCCCYGCGCLGAGVSIVTNRPLPIPPLPHYFFNVNQSSVNVNDQDDGSHFMMVDCVISNNMIRAMNLKTGTGILGVGMITHVNGGDDQRGSGIANTHISNSILNNNTLVLSSSSSVAGGGAVSISAGSSMVIMNITVIDNSITMQSESVITNGGALRINCVMSHSRPTLGCLLILSHSFFGHNTISTCRYPSADIPTLIPSVRGTLCCMDAQLYE
jgi:hypothetical protein